MGVYATVEDVRLAVARDQYRTRNTTANLADLQIEQCIADAQAEVDGRLRTDYTVPFVEPIPALVRAVTIDIAAYRAALIWGQEKELSENSSLVRLNNRAHCLLEDIANGSIDLDTGDGGAPAPRTGGLLGTPINPVDGVLFDLCDFGLSRWPQPWDPWGW